MTSHALGLLLALWAAAASACDNAGGIRVHPASSGPITADAIAEASRANVSSDSSPFSVSPVIRNCTCGLTSL
ncbi:hypothetical protein OH805_37345 [Streptomyces sp. NBC_00879]|uniref:hypothetical protein n=1 Tax=Streptomyces sp. NBC_00879 TaxID=2975855 RepID=UPI003868A7BD|nr:hypothetical protein OH805_37345 [Streptomyces sp. NBC_00879]